MAEMDDEAFARMLQQQLLDEERMLLEQQQQQQQQGHQRGAPQSMPPQQDPYQSHSAYGQDPHSQQYDSYPGGAYAEQEPFDPLAYARKLQQQGFNKQQENQPARDSRSYDHNRSRPQEDPDLALARRMHEFETMGIGNQPHGMGNQHHGMGNQHHGMDQHRGMADQHRGMGNQHRGMSNQQYGMDQHRGMGNQHHDQHRGMGNQHHDQHRGMGNQHHDQHHGMGNQHHGMSSQHHGMSNQQYGMDQHRGMGNQQQDAYRSSGGSDRTRYEQEEEDARLARLMAQSGQSLREIDFQQSAGSREASNHAAPSQYSGAHPGSHGGGRGGHSNMSYPEQNQNPRGMVPPTPQYPDRSRAQMERNVPGRNMQSPNAQMNRSNASATTGMPVRQSNSADRANYSREFDVQSFGGPDSMNQESFTPKLPPGYSSHRNDDTSTPQRRSNNRDDQGQRSPKRPPATRDRPGGTARPPFGRDEPMQGGAMASASAPTTQPTPSQPGPGRQARGPGRSSASPVRGDRPHMEDLLPGDAFLDVPAPTKKKDKKKKRGILGMFGRNGEREPEPVAKAAAAPARNIATFGRGARGSGSKTPYEDRDAGTAADFHASAGGNKPAAKPAGLKSSGDEADMVVRFPIPEPVPRPADTIGAPKGPLPYSLTVSKEAPECPEATIGRRPQLSLSRSSATCAACGRPGQNLLSALDKKYHTDCFRCMTCHDVIDSSGAFAFFENGGEKQPMHRKCYAEIFGVKCCVCKQSIPAGPDGKVSFVKHPFFDTEQMCPRHARNLTRRCTGCHRFEPENEPFADLNDVGRCVCFSCCRSVIVDSQDAQPLWAKVVDFFESKLNMPIWKDFREVPILVVGYNALNDQMNNTSNVHGGASQIMTRGLCLTEHESGRRFRMNRMKFDRNNMSFVANDAEDRGFTYFQVPDASKVNPDASVTAILCLSGLPRDLSASVLAHEATHAWIKLHPRFDFERPIPPQVEEGCAQLIALLFLNEGLDPPAPLDNNDGTGPSDEKLRQYFKFSIETDDHEIYGTGYRRAATAYSRIGIEALMSHIVLYQDFPET